MRSHTHATPRTSPSHTGDPAVIRQAQFNITRRRAGLKTPLPGEGAPPGTSRGFTTTPGTGAPLYTPAMTPLGRPDTGAATPAPGGAVDGGIGSAAAAAALENAAAAGARAPKMTLDQFFAHYTGEDNASFEGLLEQHNARKRAKHVHLLEAGKSAPLQLEGHPASTDEYGTSGQTPSSLVLWKFEPKNRLYYDSSQQPALQHTAKERAAMVAGPPKAVRYAATRIAPEVEEAQEQQLAAAGLAEGVDGSAAAGSRDPAELVAGRAAPPAQHGAAGGRAYLRTPSLAPGVGASPLMTWGEIGATPLRLVEDPDEGLAGLGIDPFGGEGPQFKLPQARRREVAAREVFDRKAAARRARGGRGASTTPLLDSMRRSTPGTPLSSAAQRLATQLGKGKAAGGGGGGGACRGAFGGGGATPKGSTTGLLADASLQLRASYSGATPGGGGGGSRSGGGTRGGSVTPQIGGRAAGSSKARQAGGPVSAAQAAAGVGAGSSITDDLLKLK